MVLVGLLVRYFFGVTLFRLSRKWRKLPQIHYRLKSGGRIGSIPMIKFRRGGTTTLFPIVGSDSALFGKGFSFPPSSVRPIGLRAPWSGAHRPLGANDLGALAFGAPHWGDASLNRPPDLVPKTALQAGA